MQNMMKTKPSLYLLKRNSASWLITRKQNHKTQKTYKHDQIRDNSQQAED